MKKALVFRHVPHEGLGTIASELARREVPIEYVNLYEPEARPSGEACAYRIVISMGGPMNADETEKYPSLAAEREFLSQAIHSGIPTLGICLGSQLIARVLGARVYSGGTKEIGWYTIELTGEAQRDPVFSGIPSKRPVVFQWHGDTFDLPKGAVCLASSSQFQNQAFRFKRHVYALQFHIEVDQTMIKDWLVKGQAELAGANPPIDPEQILACPPEYEGALIETARGIYERLFRSIGLPARERV